MKKSVNCMMAGLLSFGLIGAPVAALAESPKQTEASILLVQSAGAAELTDGRLSLSEGENTLWLDDRPLRGAGVMPFDRVLAIWDEGKNSFADDPPNAVLAGTSDDGPRQYVLELMNPRMDAGELIYDVRPIVPGTDANVSLTDVSLFIDCFWIFCNNSCPGGSGSTGGGGCTEE